MNSSEQRLPAEAIPTDRQSPLRPLSRLQSSHATSSAGSNSFLNDSPRNTSHAFEFDQGPLLAPQSSESIPPVDRDNLRVVPTRLSHNADSESSVDTTRENSVYFRNSRTTVTPESQQVQSFSSSEKLSILPDLTFFPKPPHLSFSPYFDVNFKFTL